MLPPLFPIMNVEHLSLIKNDHNRQVWQYLERIPLDVVSIHERGMNTELMVVHPEHGTVLLPNSLAEIVPQKGDLCCVVATELERYWNGDYRKWQGDKDKGIPPFDWVKLRTIYSVDGNHAKVIPFLSAPLRCFAFYSLQTHETHSEPTIELLPECAH